MTDSTTKDLSNVIRFPKPRLDRPFEENILRVNFYAYYMGICDQETALRLTDQAMDFWRPHD